VIVGAGVAQPLAEVGALLGMDVAVLDDQPDFATRASARAPRVLRVDFGDLCRGAHPCAATWCSRADTATTERCAG
jgi:hypothetical protein